MGTKNISAIERGVVGISINSLINICKTLCISSDSILFESNVKNNARFLNTRLEELSPEQFNIVNDIVNKLLEVFKLS